MKKTILALIVLALGGLPGAAFPTPPPAEDIYWYYDAETALQVAKRAERPILLLKVRADIGRDVKT